MIETSQLSSIAYSQCYHYGQVQTLNVTLDDDTVHRHHRIVGSQESSLGERSPDQIKSKRMTSEKLIRMRAAISYKRRNHGNNDTSFSDEYTRIGARSHFPRGRVKISHTWSSNDICIDDIRMSRDPSTKERMNLQTYFSRSSWSLHWCIIGYEQLYLLTWQRFTSRVVKIIKQRWKHVLTILTSPARESRALKSTKSDVKTLTLTHVFTQSSSRVTVPEWWRARFPKNHQIKDDIEIKLSKVNKSEKKKI